jgi:hypothetical protein
MEKVLELDDIKEQQEATIYSQRNVQREKSECRAACQWLIQ